MRRIIALAFSAVLAVSAVAAQPLKTTPVEWKWLSDSELYLADADSQYRVDAAFNILPCGKLPEKFVSFPIEPEGAVNLTYSPDSTMLAFTRDNDLYVVDIASGKEKRLTFDGSDVILNGYASWVYYEEIFGRPSRYRAFWWSPDSRKIAYYRFDDSRVPMFPIYSPKGQDGSLRRTHYPKAGERNPEVRIGFIDVPKAMNRRTPKTQRDFSLQGSLGSRILSISILSILPRELKLISIMRPIRHGSTGLTVCSLETTDSIWSEVLRLSGSRFTFFPTTERLLSV